MSKDIRIKKGLDIRLVGEAEKSISEGPRSRTITIRPSDFHLVTPKMVVKEGAKLQVGDELFFSKSQEQIRFVSPVAGTLVEIKDYGRLLNNAHMMWLQIQQMSQKQFSFLDIIQHHLHQI